MPLLSEREIGTKLRQLPGWIRAGNDIRKTFEFPDFARAIGWVNTVALFAEKANHHPDIDIRWNKVTLSLSTHSEGGLTEKDFSLAKEIESL